MSSDPAGNCSYRYAHPGHDRIARELSELRLREDELRGRWKEMGFEVPQVCSENETPFSLPEPIRIPNNSTSLDETDNKQQQQQQQHETEQLEDTTTTSQSSADVTLTSQPALTTPTTSGVKVRPFEDPDGDEARQRPRFTYFPADETPIQREIRRASEREEILRLSRGIVSIDHRSQRQSTTDEQQLAGDVTLRRNGDVDDGAERFEAMRRSMDLDEPTGNATGGGERGSRVSMKLLASSRLAMEIERERRRELDLKKLGCISTISDERACHPPVATNDEQVRRQSQNVDAPKSTEHVAVTDTQLLQSINCGVDAMCAESNGNITEAAGTAGSSDCGSSGQTTPRPRVSASGPAAAGAASNVSVVGAQQLRQTTELIEKELRELQLREIELRKQRASLAGLTTSDNNNDVIADVVSYMSNGDVTQERRRSALIDQWESRIVKDA